MIIANIQNLIDKELRKAVKETNIEQERRKSEISNALSMFRNMADELNKLCNMSGKFILQDPKTGGLIEIHLSELAWTAFDYDF